MIGTTDRYAERAEIVRAMKRQKVVPSPAVAEALTDAGALVTFAPGAELMREGGRDDDCYFLLSGAVALKVKGDTLDYGRGAGEVVGEFNAINPAIARTATVTALEETVALKCGSKALKAACGDHPEMWELLAVELTQKILQRNQLIAQVNERPIILMVAGEDRIQVAKSLCTALSRDYDVEFWKDEGIVPPGGFELDALQAKASAADFAIVFPHPDDLADGGLPGDDDRWMTLRFELGYLMSELTRHRTLLMVPTGGGEATGLFKGIQPMSYELPAAGVPMNVAIAQAVEAIRALVAELKGRSRLKSRA